MATNNDTPNIHGPGMPPDEHSASVPTPSDPDMPYTYHDLSPASNALIGGKGKMPGHKSTVDGAALRAEAAARYAAAQAEINAKRAAQLRADTAGKQPQHPTIKTTSTGTGKRGGKRG